MTADSPAGRPRRTQAQRSHETQQRVLNAAVQVLGERGYAGFRTAEVVTVAGVSKGALTHHFRSKDELVLAALEHSFRNAAQRGRQRARHVSSADDAIRALLEDSSDFFMSDVFLIAVDLAILGGRNAPNNARVKEISLAHRIPVENAWADALVDAGVPPPLARDLRDMTTSLVRGMAVRKLLADDPAGFDRIARLWRTMVTQYLAARTERSVRRQTA